jgi:chromosome segregation ATPase
MRKSAMTPDALPHRGTAAPFRVAIGLALAASASVMLWGVSAHGVSASEFGPNVARETPMTLEDRVAALTAELAHVKIETAKLRESQNDTSEELSHVRASLANAEMGLSALRTTTDENEAHRRDTAAQVASNLAQLKDETLHLRMAQDDTATEIGSLRAGVANSEIGLDSLRATTGEIRRQIERIDNATGSIAKSHKPNGHRKWVAQR